MHLAAGSTRETIPSSFAQQWSAKRRFVLRGAIAGRQAVVVEEARNRALRSDSPARAEIQEGHGIQVESIEVLPVHGKILANVCARRSDSHDQRGLDAGDSRAIAAGLFGKQLPGRASVLGKRGHAGSAPGILIVAADNNDLVSLPARDGEDSRGGLAVG